MENFFANDPLLGDYKNNQTQLIEEYKRRIETQASRTPLWDKIDNEIAPLTDEQKKIVFNDEEYQQAQLELSTMVQEYLLRLVKPHIEGSENGRKLLSKVYDITIVAKKKAINESNKEMELFKQWQVYSTSHPDSTYSDFIKTLKPSKK